MRSQSSRLGLRPVTAAPERGRDHEATDTARRPRGNTGRAAAGPGTPRWPATPGSQMGRGGSSPGGLRAEDRANTLTSSFRPPELFQATRSVALSRGSRRTLTPEMLCYLKCPVSTRASKTRKETRKWGQTRGRRWTHNRQKPSLKTQVLGPSKTLHLLFKTCPED